MNKVQLKITTLVDDNHEVNDWFHRTQALTEEQKSILLNEKRVEFKRTEHSTTTYEIIEL